ncbi:MAG: MATE family efflux transporter [Lachnospiraceae bacterium]
MAGSYVQDMTEGNEISLLARFSMPMLIGNIFQQFYNMVDSIVVGNYEGANALAAVGATSSLNFLFFSLCNGMSMGIGIMISQYFGAKDEVHLRKAISNTVYIIAVTGILMSVLGIILAKPILQFLHTPDVILADAVLFMQIASGGILAVAAYNAVAAILRALGDAKSPLIFLIISCLINVVLDLVFVICFGMGVMGVGIATVISQVVAAVGSLLYAIAKNPYFKISREEMRYDKNIIEKCIRLGLPVAAQSSLIAISCVALQGVVNGFGANVVAAFTATSRVEQLVQQPFNSLGAAVSTFSGQNIGARKLERVKTGYYKSVVLVALFSALMLAAAYMFGNAIMRLFVNDETVISIGAKALKITSLLYFPLGMIYVTRGLLNGAGDAFYAMANGMVEIIGRIGFANLLVLIPVIGVWGVWWATGLTWLITGLASVLRYRQGKWKQMSIADAQLEPAGETLVA